MKCTAATERLNCGCCEDTVLTCDLEDGHPETSHEMQIEENGRKYDVQWREV